MIRAFVAVPLDDGLRARLAQEIERLRRVAPNVAWVTPGNLHITLKFLGDVLPERIGRVAAALGGVASLDKFGLTIRGVGAFPSPRRPRVVWAGTTDGSTELTRLAGLVDTALVAQGFASETRAFSGHITLGRVRNPGTIPGLETAMAQAGDQEFGSLLVDRIVLMQSELRPTRATYRELAGWPLATSVA